MRQASAPSSIISPSNALLRPLGIGHACGTPMLAAAVVGDLWLCLDLIATRIARMRGLCTPHEARSPSSASSLDATANAASGHGGYFHASWSG